MSTLITVPDWDAAKLQHLAELALGEARRQGMSSAETGIGVSNGLSATVRLGEVETLEHCRDQSLAVTVYNGRRKGSASSSDLSEASVRETVQAACSIAKLTAEDECAGLADAELMAAEVPDLQMYHPWDLSPEAAVELAQACEAAALEQPGIENSEGAAVGRYDGYGLYANSHGFVGGYPASRQSLMCSVIAGEGDRMQRDDWYTIARDADQLEAAESVGRRAAERAVSRLDARKLPTGRVPVLFAPEMARTLLGHFIGGIRGSALYRRASFLLDKKGEAVFPEFVRIREQPLLPGALGSAPFDDEGVATRERDVVRDGVLQDYVLDSYSARKLGLRTTANAGGVHNLSIESGDSDRAALLKTMDRGLLVTEMMGQGVNMVTGDYSRGASGYWVENGEIQYPVQEITVAGNLQEMFHNIRAVGNDTDTRGNIRCGSVLVDSMMVAGD